MIPGLLGLPIREQSCHMERSRERSMPAAPSSAPPPPSERSPLATLATLLSWLWPRGNRALQLRLAGAVAALFAAKLATLAVPWFYARLIDGLGAKWGALPVLPWALLAGYGIARLGSSAFAELRDALFAAVQQRTVRLVARTTLAHLLELPLSFHLERRTGALARAIDRGMRGIEQVLRFSIFNILPTLLEVALVILVLWRFFDWRFAAVTGGAVVLYAAFTFVVTNSRVRLRRKMNATDAEAQTRALDSLLNYETVKHFTNEAHEIARFDTALAAYERAAIRSQLTLSLLNFGQGAIMALGLVGVMALAGLDVLAGRASLGRFVLVNTYLIQLYQPLNMLGFVYREVKQGLIDMEHLFRLLAERPPATALVSSPAAERLAANPAPAELRFEDVHFGYQPERPILRGVSFVLPAGRKLAVVGPTGAGKSTLTRLVLRFFEPSAGRILLDGLDLATLPERAVRRAIGVVPQEATLFNDTIRYNIAYGRLDASFAEIEAAARLARIHDFIMSLPEGYETRVGERGLKLSGGERQRVAIARTLLKNPRLLILDEATSALDSATERDITSALAALAENRTTFAIAHRLASIVDADEILVLDRGCIIERGTHAELLALGGLYAKMWRIQAESETSAPPSPAVRGLTSAA